MERIRCTQDDVEVLSKFESQAEGRRGYVLHFLVKNHLDMTLRDFVPCSKLSNSY